MAAEGGCVMKFLIFAVAGLLCASPADNEENKTKIARALSVGPAEITNNARVVDTDEHGNTIVLRESSNGFTCMPGNPRVVGDPPMCAYAASMQWAADFKAHKPKPTNTEPGINYMLAGATQRSDTDPYDTTSPAISDRSALDDYVAL
jgi:hypothetical protein